jgi:hypothetical protein
VLLLVALAVCGGWLQHSAEFFAWAVAGAVRPSVIARWLSSSEVQMPGLFWLVLVLWALGCAWLANLARVRARTVQIRETHMQPIPRDTHSLGVVAHEMASRAARE